MNKLTILTIIYTIGIIIGALFFDVWGAETTIIKTRDGKGIKDFMYINHSKKYTSCILYKIRYNKSVESQDWSPPNGWGRLMKSI